MGVCVTAVAEASKSAMRPGKVMLVVGISEKVLIEEKMRMKRRHYHSALKSLFI